MTDKEILGLFTETKAKLSGHFILASGRHSDTYMQCARLFMYPETSKKICAALYEKLQGCEFDFVASPAVGGVIMGYEMASQANKPNIFFERIEKQMTLRRGFDVIEGAKYLVVEDVVTTGGSVLEVCDEITKRGGIVSAVASVVDRSGGKVNFGTKYCALLQADIESFEPGDCPLCKKGLPAVKPGTRALTL